MICSPFECWGELTINNTIHLRARDYNAATGTFTKRDPLDGVAGTTVQSDPYHYALNDPLDLVDPTGLSPDNDRKINLMSLMSYHGLQSGDDSGRYPPGVSITQWSRVDPQDCAGGHLTEWRGWVWAAHSGFKDEKPDADGTYHFNTAFDQTDAYSDEDSFRFCFHTGIGSNGKPEVQKVEVIFRQTETLCGTDSCVQLYGYTKWGSHMAFADGAAGPVQDLYTTPGVPFDVHGPKDRGWSFIRSTVWDKGSSPQQGDSRSVTLWEYSGNFGTTYSTHNEFANGGDGYDGATLNGDETWVWQGGTLDPVLQMDLGRPSGTAGGLSRRDPNRGAVHSN